MSIDKSKETVTGHKFSVDIVIESDSNAQALEQLLSVLKNAAVKDFRIQKGIVLGKTIESTIEAALQQQKADADKQEADAKDKTRANSSLVAEIERYKQNNTLVRITVMQGKGVKINIPCRILNYDAASQNVSIYHVDEKKVYLFRLNEIDELQV